jgi:hypothetical protein
MRRLLLFAALCFTLTLVIATTAEAATGTIDRTAKLSRDHTMATVTGTLSCNPLVSGTGMLSVTVQQVVGRLPIQGGGSTFGLTCTGTSMPWSVTTGTVGKYAPGPASVSVFFTGQCFFGCFPPVVDSWGEQSKALLLP